MPLAAWIFTFAITSLLGLALLLMVRSSLRARRAFREMARHLDLRLATTADSASRALRELGGIAPAPLAVGERGALRVEVQLIARHRHPTRLTQVTVSDRGALRGPLWILPKRHVPPLLPSPARVMAGRQDTFLVYGAPEAVDAVDWPRAMASLAAFPREVLRLDLEPASLSMQWLGLESDPQLIELSFQIAGEWLASAAPGGTLGPSNR